MKILLIYLHNVMNKFCFSLKLLFTSNEMCHLQITIQGTCNGHHIIIKGHKLYMNINTLISV